MLIRICKKRKNFKTKLRKIYERFYNVQLLKINVSNDKKPCSCKKCYTVQNEIKINECIFKIKI